MGRLEEKALRIALESRLQSTGRNMVNAVDPATRPTGQPPTPFGTGDNGVRTNVTFMTLPSLQEMKPRERADSVKVSRFLNNRLGIVRALNENSVRFAVGEGIFSYAATGDPKYDSSADRFVDSIFESSEFDVTAEQNMYELQAVAGNSLLVDGDCGAAKILERDSAGRPASKPQTQLFTTDQIGNVGLEPLYGPWWDGVMRNDVGRALQYRVLKFRRPGQLYDRRHFDYQARDFCLVLDRKRISLGRGMPWSHHGQDNGLAMLDLDALEKTAAYVNSFFAAWIETPTGEVPEALEESIIQRIQGQTTEKAGTDAVSTETETVTRRFLNLFGGGAVPVFKNGESLKSWSSERPGAVQTGYMEWLGKMLAIGYGCPPSFVWLGQGGNGPENRVALAQADWFFKHIMRTLIARFVKPMRDWVLLYGLLTKQVNGGKLPNNGADYRLARWRGPRKITIDERYFYRTWLDRIKAGLGTEEEFYAEQGKEWSHEQRQRVTEVKALMDLCEELEVPYERVVATMPGQNAGSGPPPGEDFSRAAAAAA